MILELKVQNYLFIDTLEVSFRNGLNIIVGETGSGKSIILEAIQGLISPRLTTDIIKSECSKCYLEGIFETNNSINQWLKEQELDQNENETIITITREISEKGSKGRINGTLVPSKLIANLGEQLIEIHSQSSEQQILSAKKQIAFIDDYIGKEHNELCKEYKKKYAEWQKLVKKYEEEQTKLNDKDKEIDYLQFQLDELQSYNFNEPDEEESLKKQIDSLSQAEENTKLISEINEAYFESESNISSFLSSITKKIVAASHKDERLTTCAEQLSEINDELNEIIHELNNICNSNEEELDIDSMNLRLSQIQKMKRKHKVSSLGELIQLQTSMEQRVEYLQNYAENLEHLEKNCLKQQKELSKSTETLSSNRVKASRQLSEEISNELPSLGLKGAKFEISCLSLDKLNSDGADKIELMFQANAGDILRPLNKVASGGELSRITLILKSILGGDNSIIFDEIDSGTSGKVSRLIGEKLYKLSTKCQVLCVTHQPLVAAFGDHYFVVSKEQGSNFTELKVCNLSKDDEKIEALIDLMIGERDKILAKQYAKELLEESETKKHEIKENKKLQSIS